jgi:hypothetical protein
MCCVTKGFAVYNYLDAKNIRHKRNNEHQNNTYIQKPKKSFIVK